MIAVLLLAILMGISVLFNSDGVVAIMFFIWLGLIGVVNFFLNHYIGYLVKAGHVAVIAMAYQTGYVPAKPFEMGKTMVKERFGTSNVYFALDKLVAGSIKQLQRTLGRVTDSLLGALPGADGIKSLTNMFLDISLGYVDECCLGYTFYHPAQNPYKSAADGVIIYFQNVEDVAQGCGEDNGDGHLIVRGGYVDCVYPLRWIVPLVRLERFHGFHYFIVVRLYSKVCLY